MKIDHSVLTFLEKLRNNNNRDWFQQNKKIFEAAKSNVEQFVAVLIARIAGFDDQVGIISSKECMFRIYRDVRFSKDKSPYKTNFGAFITTGSKSSSYAGYYIHIQTGESFLAGGIYMPPPDILKKVRQEIAFNLSEFKSLIQKPTFRKYFGEISGEKLQRMPKEYSSGFGDENLLKFKDYNVIHAVTDELLCSEDFFEYSIRIFKEMKPLNHFINRALIARK